MMNRIIVRLGVLSLLVLVPFIAKSQSTTSPYSMFGIGELNTGNYNENAGMGGIGIGYRQVNMLNSSNPASVTGIAVQSLLFSGNVFGKYSHFKAGAKANNGTSGNIQNFALGFRLTNGLAMSLGVSPISSVGYEIRKSSPVEGSTGEVYTTFEGSGGITKTYFSLAYSITDRLSVGINGALAFGKITQTEKASYWTIERSARTSRPFVDFGLQYTGKLKEHWNYVLGAVAGYKTRLPMKGNIFTYDHTGLIIQDKSQPATDQYIPAFYGIGFSVNNRNRITAGIDYRFQKWSALRSETSSVTFKDQHIVSVGASIIPRPYGRKYIQNIKYQVGAVLSNSYLRLQDKNPMSYGITAGVVLPFNYASINAAIEVGKRGMSSSASKISEQYVKLTLGFTFSERAFFRFRYD